MAVPPALPGVRRTARPHRGGSRHLLRERRMPRTASPASRPLRIAPRNGHRWPRRTSRPAADRDRPAGRRRRPLQPGRREPRSASRDSPPSPRHNLIAAIEASKGRGLARLLIGLSIHHVGGTLRRRSPRSSGTSTRSIAADPSLLAATPGVGPTIAASVSGFFSLEANRALVERLRAAGVDLGGDAPGAPRRRAHGGGAELVLSGRTVRWSPDPRGIHREEAEGGHPSPEAAGPPVRSPPHDSGRRRAEPGAARASGGGTGVPLIDEAAFVRLLEEGRTTHPPRADRSRSSVIRSPR